MVFEAYAYCIRNRVTGEFYFGSRSANLRQKRTPKEDFKHHYQSSSMIMKRTIIEQGVDAFNWEILTTGGALECYWYEQDLIKEHRSNPKCLNRHFIDRNNGKAFCVSGIPKTAEHRAKIGAAQKGRQRSDQERANLSFGQRMKAPMSAATRAKISAASKGKAHSPEHNAKIAQALSGRKRPAETIEKMSKTRKGISAHPNTKRNLLSALECPHCGKSGSLPNMKRWHFDKCPKLT